MRIHPPLFFIATLAITLVACKQKEALKNTDLPKPAQASSSEKPAAAKPSTPQRNAAERANQLGFVKHLAQDTEVVVSYHNGKKIADRIQSSKLWKLVQSEMGVSDQSDPNAADEPTGPAALFATEFTMALGKPTGEQTANLLTFSSRLNYLQMRALPKAFAAAMKSNDLKAFSKSLQDSRFSAELTKDLLNDPESGITLLQKMQLPPLYLAFKTTEANRSAAAQELAAIIANVSMLGPMVKPIATESAGYKFEGMKILGSEVSKVIAAERRSMDQELGASMVDQILAAMNEKNIVALSGTVGDYVVLFIGGDEADLKLAADVDHSLTASTALAFSDAYASKELAAMIYVQKEMLASSMASLGGMETITSGLRDGIAATSGLGDTRDLEAMLKIVSEREAVLRKLGGYDASGMIAFFEDGLKIESFGGVDTGSVDWNSPNQLASLGDSEQVVLFANMTTDAIYDEKARAYAESLLETGYAMTMKFVESPSESDELLQFKGLTKWFDLKLRSDVTELWDTFSHDCGPSLGQETAFIVDLNGSAPTVPGLPQAVVDHAKAPRISVIKPVKDRAKLASSWDKMNATLTSTLGKISDLTGSKIPMQKPISSEKNDITTWFFPMPFLNDDFIPSISLNNQWLVASSSKNQALDLMAKASSGGAARDGFFFRLNFKALENYARDTFKVVDENAEALTGAPLSEAQKKLIKASIVTLGNLDSLTVHSRREDGTLRSSVHFKAR